MQEEHEQITKVPADLEAASSKVQAGTGNQPTNAGRVKNPKKVAAGKALARRNKEAREAQKRLEELEASKDVQPLSLSDASGWFLSAAGVAGGCLTLYHAYKLFFPEEKPDERSDAIVEEEEKPRPVPHPPREEEEQGNLIDME